MNLLKNVINSCLQIITIEPEDSETTVNVEDDDDDDDVEVGYPALTLYKTHMASCLWNTITMYLQCDVGIIVNQSSTSFPTIVEYTRCTIAAAGFGSLAAPTSRLPGSG